jgi:hypothetical protein
LKTIERTLLFDALYADMASERRATVDGAGDAQQPVDLAQGIINPIGDDPDAVARFLAAHPLSESTLLPNFAVHISDKLVA